MNMTRNRSKRVIIEGESVFLYNQDFPQWMLNDFCPPEDLEGTLSQAWICMQPGMFSGYGRGTIEDIVKYLSCLGISKRAARWASEKADKYFDDREGFNEFIKSIKETE